MARAETIWLVMHLGHPKAAFTVKHELETWLSKQEEDFLLTAQVWRLADNPYSSSPVPALVPLDSLKISPDDLSAWSQRRSWDS